MQIGTCNLRRIVITVIVLVVAGLTATAALANSPHFKKGREPNCLRAGSAISKSVTCGARLAVPASVPGNSTLPYDEFGLGANEPNQPRVGSAGPQSGRVDVAPLAVPASVPGNNTLPYDEFGLGANEPNQPRVGSAGPQSGRVDVAPRAVPAGVPGNTVQQWNKVAEDTVVSSGAFQGEGYVYMAYTSAAVYDAVVAIQGGYEPYGPAIAAPAGASVDAAVVEAAYRTLSTYFPSSCNTTNAACMALGASLLTDYNAAMALIPPGTAKTNGMTVGAAAAAGIVALRTGDGRLTPIASTSPFEKKDPGPGVWRLTPTAYAAPQTPWLGSVQPFLLKRPGQFKTKPPVPLRSKAWVRAFDEVKAYGKSDSAVRTAEQTATAYFYTTNVIRQFNRAARDLATAKNLGLLQTARLFAMVNAVGADALMSTLNQKYHFLFWRPVTAIDPTSVTTDGFGPSPTGFDDGNPATVEQTGWRPLLPTPNHPEYPSAHGTITSGMAEVFSEFLGTDQIDLNIHGSTDATGNLVAVRHFDTAHELRADVVNARTWGGLHYRFSTEAGVQLGQKVAHYGLNHAFKATH